MDQQRQKLVLWKLIKVTNSGETSQGKERYDTKEHYSGRRKRCKYGFSRWQDSKEISWMTLLVRPLWKTISPNLVRLKICLLWIQWFCSSECALKKPLHTGTRREVTMFTEALLMTTKREHQMFMYERINIQMVVTSYNKIWSNSKKKWINCSYMPPITINVTNVLLSKIENYRKTQYNITT